MVYHGAWRPTRLAGALAFSAGFGCDPVAPEINPTDAPAARSDRTFEADAAPEVPLDAPREPTSSPDGAVAPDADGPPPEPLDAAPDEPPEAAADAPKDVTLPPEAALDVVTAPSDVAPGDLPLDASAPGACGGACGPGARCDGGVCQCAEGLGDCDGLDANGCEVDLLRDVNHCGVCGLTCPEPRDGAARCVMGACVAVCAAGRAPCVGECADLRTNPRHCGGCDQACSDVPLPNGGMACMDSRCTLVCRPGFSDCNRDARDGCEVDVAGLHGDVRNCGACGRVCTPGANQWPMCSIGRCLFSCLTGFEDCDRSLDSCEIDLRNRVDHCGACGAACPSGQRCAEGRCHALVLSSEPRCLDLGAPPTSAVTTTVYGPPGARVVKYCRKLCALCSPPARRAEGNAITIQPSGVGVGAVLTISGASTDCNDVRLGRYECWVEIDGDGGARLESPHVFATMYNSQCPSTRTCEATAGFCPVGIDPYLTCLRPR